MHESDNTRVVKEAYAAFGRGDIQGVLTTLHDEVVWKPIEGAGPQVPTSGERRGKAAVAEFFRILSETTTFEQFEPREFIAQHDKVVALGHYRAMTNVGGRFESDWSMIFTFRDGRIVQFQEFTNVAAINEAFATVSASA